MTMLLRVRSAVRQFRIPPPVKYLVIAAVCGWAAYIQLYYRVPSIFVFILLPWIGAVLALLHILLLANHFVSRLSADEQLKDILRRVEWWASLVVRVHVYVSLFLYANAKLDRTFPVEHRSVALSIMKTNGNALGRLPMAWINLRSWHTPQQFERLVLTPFERDNLWGGESVLVKVHAGYFHVEWVSSIERDTEYYAKQVLEQLPTASLAWKGLINFYLQRNNTEQVVQAARQYMQYYPQDYRFLLSVGGYLGSAGHYSEAIPFLEHALQRHPSYTIHQQLGWTLSYQGNKERAAEVLEASIPLAPDDWEAYYHLGYVYIDLGKPAEALGMFEEVLKRQRHFPEVESQVTNLRKHQEFLNNFKARQRAVNNKS
jgi:tetratricopeptide (TPR) repeat protein